MAKTLAIVGKVAFVVGVLFAIVGGIWGGKSHPTNDFVIVVLLIAGILIGLLNITAKEAPIVLSAAVALIILGISIQEPPSLFTMSLKHYGRTCSAWSVPLPCSWRQQPSSSPSKRSFLQPGREISPI